jgi:hypothetical protein
MIAGVEEFTRSCKEAGLSRRDIVRNRILMNRNVVGLDREPLFLTRRIRPRLVFTSPPYAGVNVLYHRWQYRGRKETPAPYWIANVPDGCGSSFYTGGSRTPTGLKNYFDMIVRAFSSVSRIMDPKGFVIQLVGFSDTSVQLPEYLDCMRCAGFTEYRPKRNRLRRQVPNRKWYAKLKGHVDASTEVLLIHHLS